MAKEFRFFDFTYLWVLLLYYMGLTNNIIIWLEYFQIELSIIFLMMWMKVLLFIS